MSEKKFANEPMLYIQQPSITRPEAPMQHQYTTPKKTNKTIETKSSSIEEANSLSAPRKKVRRNTFYQQLTEADEKAPERVVDEKKERQGYTVMKNEVEIEDSNLSEKKQFKEMSIKEKISYFVESPNYVPKLKCEIKAKDQTYRGFVMEFKDDTVFVQIGRSPTTTSIPFANITDIRMIGF